MTIDNLIHKNATARNRIQSGAFVIAAGLTVLFCTYFTAPNLLRPNQLQAIKLDSRINPNGALTASLVRLPGIGLGRAEAIVAYCRNFRRNNNAEMPFQNSNDLQKVKGIGPKTVQNISQWLKFE